MEFTHLLHELVALVGCPVVVSANTSDGHPVLTMLGVIEGAVPLAGEADTKWEVLYIPVRGSAGFVLTRKAFKKAQWHGDCLRITLGTTVVEIQPQ